MRSVSAAAMVAMVLGLAGCGLSETDAVNQIGTPYCEKLQTCFPADFADVYAGGVQDCVGQVIVATQKANGNSTCSSDATCKSDINALTCSGDMASTPLPASCQTCLNEI